MGHGTDRKAYACRNFGLWEADEVCMVSEERGWDISKEEIE